jgi:hypothetical protein
METTASRKQTGGRFVAQLGTALLICSDRTRWAGPNDTARRPMEKDYLVLKRASANRPSGEWNEDDFDVLADGAVVGRIFKANATPVGMSWMWTLAFGHHEDRTPTHGYADTREAAMAAFAKSWRRG